MPFARFLPLLFSLVAAAGLWALAAGLVPGEAAQTYSVLIYDDSVPESEIVRRLENAGITGLITEAGQWVFLDGRFGLERVPLTEHRERVPPFDPRNDGYAEKLLALFSGDGRRFLYIPPGFPGLRDRLAPALYGVSWELERVGPERPVLPHALLFLAAVGLFALRPLRGALGTDAAGIVPCLPALFPFALGGAAGLALAALLAGLGALLAGSCREPFFPERGGLCGRARLSPLKRRLPAVRPAVSAAMLGSYLAVVFLSDFPTLPGFAIPAAFAVLCVFSLRVSAPGACAPGVFRRGAFAGAVPGRRRFSPVRMLPRSGFDTGFSWAVLPFALAAVFSAFLGFALPERGGFSPLPPGGAVTEEDYRSHFVFQATFSARPLREPVLDQDFNATPTVGFLNGNRIPYEMPPFPLAGLLEELGGTGPRSGAEPRRGLFFALLPLVFVVPGLVARALYGKRDDDASSPGRLIFRAR